MKKICDRCKKSAKVEFVVLEEKTAIGDLLIDMLLCKKCENDLKNLIRKWLKSV
jgi:hypothetical protein